MDKLALEEDESSIQETFKEIKSYVKKINQSEYYDFYTFVEGLDTKIEAIFSGKLKTLTKKFIYSMANYDENQIDCKGMLMEGNTTHIVAIRNGLVIVEPPICDSKRYYLNRLHEKIQVVCD